MDILEQRRVLSSGLPTFHFDFGPSGAPVASGYTGVGSLAFSKSIGYGWQTASSVYTGSNSWPNDSPVIDDFAYSVNNTFEVVLPNGTYTVVPTLGNFASSQSQVKLTIDGSQVPSNLSTAAEQFLSPGYQVHVSSQLLTINIDDMAGGDFWLDALSILPGQVQTPTASAGSSISADAGTPVTFSAATATGMAPLSYSWYFGDSTSSTSTSLNPTYTYSSAGTYTALLTVTDKNLLIAGSPVNVIAAPALTANAGPNYTVNDESTMTFAGSVTGGTAPYTESWNFGDGTTATGTLTPTHVYTTPGTYSAALTVTDAAGASSSSSLVVTVDDVPPTANIGGPYQGNAQTPVQFSASATDVNPTIQSELTYSWNFGDGSTATGQDPSHAFANDGAYTVSLTVADPYGAQTKVTTVVDIYPSVSAGTAQTVNAGATVNFAGTAVGAGSFTYSWNFGDGSTSTGTLDPTHVYQNPGTYTATLTATDSKSFSSSGTVAVTVDDVPPTVSLTAPSTGTAGSAVSFAATATDISPADQAAGFTFSWTFGDGSTASGADPSHTYTAAGTYTVKVTATDEYGKSGTASASIVISTNSILSVSAGSALTTNAGSAASFSGSVSGGTSPYTYSWTFGDGTGSPGTSASFVSTDTTTGGNWIGTYGAAGYNVIGDSSSYPSYATVTASGETEYTYASSTTSPQALQTVENPSNRIAACWYSSTSFDVSLNLTDGSVHPVSLYLLDWYDQGLTEQINVLNAATGAVLNSQAVSNFADGEYVTWDASGDVEFQVTTFSSTTDAVVSGLFIGAATGNTIGGATLTPSHVYANPGTYTAMLTATDSAGHIGSASTTVTVRDVPPTVTLSDPAGTIGVPVNFSAIATDVSPAVEAAGFTYSWNFGDGTTGTGATPSHAYSAAGTYTVKVTATDEYGDSGTASMSVMISSLVAGAGTNITTTAGSTVTFAGSASGGVAPYTEYWSFGDGTAAIGTLDPTHVYEAGGTYTATLTVTDSQDASVSHSAVVTVNDVAPTASLSIPSTGTVGVPVDFSASATDPSPVDQVAGFSYAWNFGDGTTGGGVTPVHLYTAAGTYTVSVTATDKDGLTSSKATATIVVSEPSSSSTVDITSSWLEQQGSAPYVLDQPNTTYVLETNVTTTGTAFVVLAPNITFNLNGYTVTYGNSSPIAVPNGGFESGSGTNVPDWNITGAPSASLASNNVYLFGNQVLSLNNFSATQTIISDPIPITLTNHTYEATITPGNTNVAYGTSVTINVIDSVTGAILGTGSSANTQRGFSAVAAFTPTTTDPVELQVIVTPPSGVTTSVDLDEATLNVSYDYGIIASGAWSGDFPGSGAGFSNLPASVQNLYSEDRTSMLSGANFILENGSVVQGQGDGTNSSPLFFEYLGGFSVNNVNTYDTGVDTTNLDATNAGGNVSIGNSTFQDNIPNVTDRMNGPATLSFYDTTGNIMIDGNRILGSPQVGIGVSNNNDYSLAIDDNTISQNAMVADAYAIGVVAVSNFQIEGNTIDPTSGEGIDVDGYTSTGSNNGVIQSNYIDVAMAPNREMANNTQDCGLRLRNDVDSEGPQTNIDISGNTIIANCGTGYSQYAYGVWISYANNNGAMNNAEVNLHDNTFEAISNVADTNHDACALVLDQVDAGIDMTIWNNVLESNDTSLSIGGYNDGNINDVTFLNNTLDISTAGPAMTYTGILAGYDVTQINNVSILDTQLENGATATITWSGSGTKTIQVGMILNVQVENSNGTPTSGATVVLDNSAGTQVYQGTTNSQGEVSDIPLFSMTYAQAGTNPSDITTTTSGSYTIEVTVGGQTTTFVVNATGQEPLNVWMT